MLLVHGIRDNHVREKLGNLDLNKCTEILKSSGITQFQDREISTEKKTTNYVKRKENWRKEKPKGKIAERSSKPKGRKGGDRKREKMPKDLKEKRKECKFCSRRHPRKEECTVWV